MDLRWKPSVGNYTLYDNGKIVGMVSPTLEGNEPTTWTTIFNCTGGGLYWLDRMSTEAEAMRVVETAYRAGKTWTFWYRHPELGREICDRVRGKE